MIPHYFMIQKTVSSDTCTSVKSQVEWLASTH